MVRSESRYQGFLEGLGRERLQRSLVDVEPVDARMIRVAGRDYVNLASNDYLGLRFRQALVERAAEGVRRYGAGSGASRLVTGNLELFAAIEGKLAKLKGKPAALVLASGFQANAAVLAALFDRAVLGAEPLVVADRLNHASMHFGCKAAGVREIRYRHGDAAHLAELLSQYQGDNRPRFILTESVFSMDGDVAPLDDIVRLARAHDACLIVDDAHATGILGRAGGGLSDGADIVIGTFSKALGSFGAYVACSVTMRDYLINRCGGLIYSTALPPQVLGAIDAALDLIPSMDEDRAYVARLAARFRTSAAALGQDTGNSSTQIVPLIVGAPEAALQLSEALRERGFWATAIRPPTVPAGTARIRLAFTRAHQERDIDLILEGLAETAGPAKVYARARPA